jgi:hypothetical protein
MSDLERYLTAPTVATAGRVVSLHLDVDDVPDLARLVAVGVQHVPHAGDFDPSLWRAVAHDLSVAKAQLVDQVNVPLIDPTLGVPGAQEPPC